MKRLHRVNRVKRRARQGGFVLYIVVIMLLLIAVVAATQLSRSQVDQRLAANLKDNMLLDHAAERVLRWCEAQALRAYASGVQLKLAQGTATVSAAMTAANWSDGNIAYTYDDVAMSGLAAGGQKCIVEEFAVPLDPTAVVVFATPPSVFKLVVTARVTRDTAGFAGRHYFAQSELRIVR